MQRSERPSLPSLRSLARHSLSGGVAGETVVHGKDSCLTCNQRTGLLVERFLGSSLVVPEGNKEPFHHALPTPLHSPLTPLVTITQSLHRYAHKEPNHQGGPKGKETERCSVVCSLWSFGLFVTLQDRKYRLLKEPKDTTKTRPCDPSS